MNELIDFLTARLSEDEALANACHNLRQPLEDGEVWVIEDYVPSTPDAVQAGAWVVTGPDGEDGIGLVSSDARSKHVARHDPARVLAEVAAKRRLIGNHQGDDKGCCRTCAHWTTDWVDGHKVDRLAYEGVLAPCLTLRLLALPYWDHLLYDERWKP